VPGQTLKLVMNSRSGDAPHDDWNRPAGRPRTSWMSRILRDTRLTAADAWAVADDRSTWRALRPTAGYTQHWLTDFIVHSVDQGPNLRHLCEPLRGTEGLIETVGFKKTTERYVVKNKRECQQEWVPYWGGSNAETVGNKSCVDPRNWQQIGVGGA